MWRAHGNQLSAFHGRSHSFVGWWENGGMRTLMIAAMLVVMASQSRQRPPEGVPCAANDLTAYTGVVIAYQRGREQTTMRIRTDWATTEDVTVSHGGESDPRAVFRYAGKPFTEKDWARIELPNGSVRSDTRATAWVCADRTVLVDWSVPKEP
jgi:hypothetical protein